MFRKITVSLEILSDTSKRTYIDTRQAADRAKKERYAEMNKKKRVMVDVSPPSPSSRFPALSHSHVPTFPPHVPLGVFLGRADV